MSTWLLVVFLCRPQSANLPCKLYPVTVSPLTNEQCVQMHYEYAQDPNYRGGRCVMVTEI